MHAYRLEGFSLVQRGSAFALVRTAHADVVAGALLAHKGCEPAGAGRGPLFRFPLDDAWGMMRPFRRGGIMRHFLQDGFLFTNRPRRELLVHAYCHRLGLPVPEPLGASWERRGIVFRGAFATRELHGQDLLAVLKATPNGQEGVLEAAGDAVRAFHEAGVFHADLQLRNLFVGDGGKVFLLDLDKAVRTDHALPEGSRIRNLLRLRRSFEKNGLEPSHFERLMRGYGQIGWGWWDTAYRIKGRGSDLLSGRSR